MPAGISKAFGKWAESTKMNVGRIKCGKDHMIRKARENQPKISSAKFICPNCGVLAKQDWTDVVKLSKTVNSILNHLYLNYRQSKPRFRGMMIGSDEYQQVIEGFYHLLIRESPRLLNSEFIPNYFKFARCQSCSEFTVWLKKEMIYPRSFSFPEPNEDLNYGIKKLYREAATVFQDSPRASAALLRLCIEELCQQLGETGVLNTCIGNLVKKGLNTQIQQALDYCRVIGNNAVHAGKIDLEEDPNKVSILFDLVNDIAYEMITKPNEMERKYSSLPEGARKAIANRDKSTT